MTLTRLRARLSKRASSLRLVNAMLTQRVAHTQVMVPRARTIRSSGWIACTYSELSVSRVLASSIRTRRTNRVTASIATDRRSKNTAYGALKTPHVFVVDAKGVLIYRGGVDNAPIGVVDPERPHLSGHANDALENYLEYALADLAAHKALRLADTPAYGCTVKYGSE
jgi:hypothetical protein